MLSNIINCKLYPVWKLGKAFQQAITIFSVCMSLSIGAASFAQADENTWLYYSGHPVDYGDTRLTWFIDPFSLKTFGAYNKQITILYQRPEYLTHLFGFKFW